MEYLIRTARWSCSTSRPIRKLQIIYRGSDMNKQEYLLTCLSEEAGEVIQAVSKALRFGLTDKYGGKTNLTRLSEEVGDFIAILTMLDNAGVQLDDNDIEKAISDKITKVEKYMEYSTLKGCLS